MNHFSGLLLATGLIVGIAAPLAIADDTDRRYGLHYTVKALPETASAAVTMTVQQSRALLREVSFPAGERVSAISGDGDVDIENGLVTWLPPAGGGSLRWQVKVDHVRTNGSFDALLGSDWGIFRFEDIIPRARTRSLVRATSDTRVTLQLPRGWGAIAEYRADGNTMAVDRDGRRFAEPAGWVAIGVLGIRRETIAGSRVAVAGPAGQDIRRMDMLALLNWTLPELDALLGRVPERLTIVSARDPMWRGGLSAPQSLFLHADRPLISENATSTLLHELMHVALGISAAPGHDWIVEGLAEYYSLELLHRGGAITTRRYRRAIEDMEAWATTAKTLCGRSSKAETTALAVVTLRRLDAELRRKNARGGGLDSLAARLAGSAEPVSLKTLTELSGELLDAEPVTLRSDKLPGCRTMTS